MGDHGITTRGLTRTFGTVAALQGLDLEVARGEVTALVGANGAGKTTLMLILATLLAPGSGEVRVAGLDPVRQPVEVRQRMGWAPDVFGLYDELTVAEYLDFFATLHRVPPQKRRPRAHALLERAGLGPLADQPVHGLSRGQKQRLGVLRALVHDPQVLLLDEPMAGLDPRSRVQMRALLRDRAAGGGAVLISSHQLDELEQMADTVVFMDAGRAVETQRIGGLDAAADRRRVRLRALDHEVLVQALHRLGHALEEVTATSADVTVADEPAAADLIAALVREGVQLVSCAPVGGALESRYLALTETTA